MSDDGERGILLISIRAHHNQISSQPMRNYLTPQPSSAIRRRWSFTGHTKVIRAIAWSPDGRRFASASEDAAIHIWDVDL